MLGILQFILVGWPEREKEYGLVGPTHCEHCQFSSDFHLFKTRRWLTVFFIPILPLGRATYYLACRECGTAVKIDRKFAKQCKEMVKITRLHLAENTTYAEYEQELEAFQTTFREMSFEPESDEPQTCEDCGDEIFPGHDYCRDCRVERQLTQ